MASTTTTLKLSKKTKARLDNLKEYRRETYDEILEKILEILTLSKINPEKARSRLISIDRKKRRSTSSPRKRPSNSQITNQSNPLNTAQKQHLSTNNPRTNQPPIRPNPNSSSRKS